MQVVRLVFHVATHSAPDTDARRENKLHSFPMTTSESGFSGTPASIMRRMHHPMTNRPAVRPAAAAADDAGQS